jgi:hypothetical protein
VRQLNGRVSRLEATINPAVPNACRACGLRHVRPLTIELVRGLLRIEGGAPDGGPVVRGPAPLCLCAPCCAAPGDRWFARLSHGLGPESDAA